MNVSNDSKKVFSYFVNLNTIFGLLSWIAILVTHIYWCRARKAQGVTNEMLPYAAPVGVWRSYGALCMCILIALCKNFEVFTKGNWDTASFFTGYLGIPIFLVPIFGYKIVYKTKGYKTNEVDLFSGKDIIDREEEGFLARKTASKAAQANEVKGKGRWIYRHFVAWLL